MLESAWSVVVPFLPDNWQVLLSNPTEYTYVFSMPGERYFVRELAQLDRARLPAVISLGERAFFGLIEREGNFDLLVVKKIMTKDMAPKLFFDANVELERQGSKPFETVVYYVLNGICGRPQFALYGVNVHVDYECVTWIPSSCFLVDDKGSRIDLPPVSKKSAVQYVVEGLLRAANRA